MCRISQSLKSVSHVPENSESLVCVYVMNTSILLICVNRIEYHRVSSLCQTYRLSWSKFIFLPCWISLMLSSVFCHADYLRSWDLCLSCWISQSLSVVSSVEYLRPWYLCVICEYLRSLDLCLPCWISQVLRSVSFCWISQSFRSASSLGENLRSSVLCQLWGISQSLKSVSDVQNFSGFQVCVTCASKLRVSSLFLRDEYLNTPDLCQTYTGCPKKNLV